MLKSTIPNAATLLDTVTVSSTGGTYTSILDVRPYRKIALYITISYNQAGNIIELLPVGSPVDGSGMPPTAPAAGADSWYALTVTDGSPVAGTLAGTVPTGADYSAAPDFAELLYRAGVIRTEPADNATDELRLVLKIDVEAFRWFQLSYAKVDGGTSPTMSIKWAPILE